MFSDLLSWNIPMNYYLISFALIIVFHIVIGVVFSKVAQAEKHEHPNWAWIPFLNILLLVQLAGFNKLVLLAFLGLFVPFLWIFFVMALVAIVIGSIHRIFVRNSVSCILLYLGLIIPFVIFIPLYELYTKTKYKIINISTLDI